MTHATLQPTADAMYAALKDRDPAFEGVFVVGVRTTGIFCRPTCPARKPRRENVEFFVRLTDALGAGYRPCLRCRPLERAGTPPEWLRGLLAAVEADPGARWRDADLQARGLDPARVRRWFQKEHGMSFHAYQRSRRLGHALGLMQSGADLTDTGFAAGFESTSGFRAAFRRWFDTPPGRGRDTRVLQVTRITSPLGPFLAAATADALCLLEFTDRRMLATQVERLSRRLRAHWAPGENAVLRQTRAELDAYFRGTRKTFSVPVHAPGTPFQEAVWAELRRIPYGETRSYEQLASRLGKPGAQRAVGRANGDNRLAVIIPCHRVVRADGSLSGYGGGVWRKERLLALEGVR